MVNGNRIAAVQDSHAQGRIGIIQAQCQKTVVVIVNDRQLACDPRTTLFTNTRCKEPGVTRANPGLRCRAHSEAQSGLWCVWCVTDEARLFGTVRVHSSE